ncbi:MAG: hypothetical protein E6929_13185 [Clostridium sp.]|nr:hypothetical protein [Clostridium sp.]
MHQEVGTLTTLVNTINLQQKKFLPDIIFIPGIALGSYNSMDALSDGLNEIRENGLNSYTV